MFWESTILAIQFIGSIVLLWLLSLCFAVLGIGGAAFWFRVRECFSYFCIAINICKDRIDIVIDGPSIRANSPNVMAIVYYNKKH